MANTIEVTEDNTTVYVGDGDKVIINIAGGGSVTIKADSGSTVTKFTIEYLGDDHSDTAHVDLSTFSEDNLEITVKDYDETDGLDLIGASNYSVDPEKTDELNFDYTGSDSQTHTGRVKAADGDSKDFTSTPRPIIVCFAEGTIIETDLGPRPVESLLTGDLIVTQDRQLQPLRWVGQKRLDSLTLGRSPELRPVRVLQGALGGGLPWRDLLVSPQHRLLISDWRAEYLFGEPEVLVAAKHLVGAKSIEIATDLQSIRYFHLLFDHHEIILANGVPAESLYCGEMAIGALGPEICAEIARSCPDLASGLTARKTARPVVTRAMASAVLDYAA